MGWIVGLDTENGGVALEALDGDDFGDGSIG